MTLYQHLDQLPESLLGGAVAIGNFDGVHRGHQRIVERLLHHARRLGRPALAFTFDPHPAVLLRPDTPPPPPLTTTERKAELLAELGVDGVLAYPTDLPLLRLTAREFFQLLILDRLRAACLVEGPNFYFGRDREGDVEMLVQWCREHGVQWEIVSPARREGDDQLVSSSLIRDLIRQGRVDLAWEALGRPHRVQGKVVEGARRGRTLGFPTANVESFQVITPAPGVYAGAARVAGRAWTPAAINIGPRPTFDEHSSRLETHLIGYDGDLYGRELAVDFYAPLREIQTFSGMDALQVQLAADVERARQVFALRHPATSPREQG